MRDLANRVLRRFIGAEEKAAKKRMILMMGPPAAGKGFFLGEPEKDDDGKVKKYKDKDGKERDTRFGWKLPQMLINDEGKPILTEDDVPDQPAADESDNHLRALQFNEAKQHFARLKSAHAEGEDAFKEALDDHWYNTKDGEKVTLSKFVKHGDLPEDFSDYFKKVNKDFYVSMRGWHDDASEKNTETGKPKERFKDEARHMFDDAVEQKIQKADDFLIVDSAGEDIDAQDYKGQIESAKRNGYEVTVIFLHPEQADTELSNLARGKVMGKRMVDQSDIDNWYKRNEDALKDIQSGNPDNFVHYRKSPPDPDPKKAAELRAKARDLMNELGSLDGDAKKKAKGEINDILYTKAAYKMLPDSSWGASKHLPDDPPENVASKVKEMNSDAEERHRKHSDKPPKEEPKEKDEPKKEEPSKGESKKDDEPKGNGSGKKDDEKSKTRMDFLRDMGDRKVPNTNPKSRERFPQVQVRSLPWESQKKYYDQWAQKQAAIRVAHRHLMPLRVAHRYLMPFRVAERYVERVAMTMKESREGEADDKSWLGGWMKRIAEKMEKDVKVEGYEVSTKASKNPVMHVIFKGAAEDSSVARKARPQVEKVLEAAIKDELPNIDGFSSKVASFNKGSDLVLECTIVFPK